MDVQGSSNLSVALLLSELDDIRDISIVFRKLGVVPYFYEDLKSFWQGTLERIPTIAIVDVKKMNENGMVLKDHPAVLNEDLPLLFFYTDKTEPLLVSTQEVYHLGSFKRSKNYEGHFRALLKRINKFLQLEQENYHLKIELNAKNEELNRFELKHRDDIKIDLYSKLVRDLSFELESNKDRHDFFECIEQVFNRVNEFESFSFAELALSGQKLVSPIVHSKKYRALPSIWLSQSASNGIDVMAQNMAGSVASEVLGDRVVTLLIRANESNPELVLFIKSIDELCFEHFDWNLLELFLNGLYSNYKLKNKSSVENKKIFGSSFEAYAYLDQFLYLNGTSPVLDYNTRLINLDMRAIANIIFQDGTKRFYWKNFKDDFISKIEIMTGVDFKIIENSVLDFGFLVKEKDSDLFFNKLKDLANRFQTWKYFENAENVMFNELKLKVNMVPLSAHAYIAHQFKSNDAINLNTASKLKPLVLSRAVHEV